MENIKKPVSRPRSRDLTNRQKIAGFEVYRMRVPKCLRQELEAYCRRRITELRAAASTSEGERRQIMRKELERAGWRRRDARRRAKARAAAAIPLPPA